MGTTWQKDARTGSYSFITEMTIRKYLEVVEKAYADRGGIAEQREPLKTATARRIRKRMLEDLILGAILPPLVLGVAIDDDTFSDLPLKQDQDLLAFLPEGSKNNIAIIDGMQRTTALLEACEKDIAVNDKIVRVEFWLAKSVHSLVYRMLVLNTGQVPWTLAKQLSVVYRSLISEISSNVDNIERIISDDSPGRRVNPGEYSSSILVELYLSFSSRKSNIDTKQAVSEQFAQLDFVENLSRNEFQVQFYEALRLMVDFDVAFSRYSPTESDGKRFKKGRNIFDAAPARIGFIVAIAQNVIGRAGTAREEAEQSSRLHSLIETLKLLLKKINSLDEEELAKFLALDVLQQVLEVRSGKVGEFERAVFEKAFSVLIDENVELTGMESCWRAY